MLKNSWLSLPTNPEQHWRSLCKRPGWKLFSMVLKQWCEKVLLPALMLWELHASSRSRAIVGTWRRLGSLVKWPHALRSWKLSHENLECVFVSLKKKAFPFWGMVVKKERFHWQQDHFEFSILTLNHKTSTKTSFMMNYHSIPSGASNCCLLRSHMLSRCTAK